MAADLQSKFQLKYIISSGKTCLLLQVTKLFWHGKLLHHSLHQFLTVSFIHEYRVTLELSSNFDTCSKLG